MALTRAMCGPRLATLLVALLALPSLAISTPTTVFTLPGTHPASWFENLAVRPNGKILATRGDAPEIWQIDPATKTGSLLVTVSGAYNLTGIAEVNPRGSRHRKRGETYIFGSSHIPEPLVVVPGSAKVWKLQMGTSGAPTVALLAAMPSAGFINGIASWGSDSVLLSDTDNEAVYLMDATTGAYTTPLTGLTGINGIQTAPGYLYRADHLSLTLSRIPISSSSAAATGAEEIIATNQLIDDFAIDVDASGAGKAYVGAMYDNAVVEVAFGPAPSAGPGVKTLVAGDLTGTGVGICTVTVFGRRHADKHLLYATVGQGGTGSASIVVIDPTVS